MAIQLAFYEKRTFATYFFLGISRVTVSPNSCQEQVLKDLDIKYSMSKTRKTSKDQKKLFARGLQNGCSEKV